MTRRFSNAVPLFEIPSGSRPRLAGVRLKNKFIGAKIATRTRKGCSSTLADSLPFSSPGALNRGAPESQVSQQTPRWREMDSNFRFRARRNREILLSRRSSTDLVWLRPPDGLDALAPRVEEFGDAGSCYLPAHRSGHWPWRDAIGQEPRNGKMKNQHRRIQQSTRVTLRLGILGACQGDRHLLEY